MLPKSQIIVESSISKQINCNPTVLLMCVFVAVGMCLLNRCLAVKGGIHFIEPLSINDKRDSHTDTQTDWRDL
jgi:hypothetical protein